jgi:replicative DNA helicase
LIIENTILRNLISNDEYVRKVLPFIQKDYFKSQEDQILFKEIDNFVSKYKKIPTYEALQVEIDQNRSLTEDQYTELRTRLHEFSQDKPDSDIDWLMDKTEEWCQERACMNAVMKSLAIIEGDDKKHDKHHIPELMRTALGVNFDTDIGHDYFRDAQARYEYYNNPESRIPFDIELLNKITKGGVKRKSLNVFVAGTGVGKSLSLCHLAAMYIAQGRNVLYITLEMPEEEVANRVDANLFNTPIDNVPKIQKKNYLTNIKRLYKKFAGRLVIKEYPTSSAHAGHFRFLLKELEIKKNFKPDVLIVDYLGICASARYKTGGINHSLYLKSVAEELRGLGQEFKIPVWTAAQYNREGMGDGDADLDDIAESIGITHTADLVIGIHSNEELDNLNQYLFKQLKNRHGNINHFRRILIGVEKDKSKLYNLSESAQETIVEENLQVEDNNRRRERNFDGFKV